MTTVTSDEPKGGERPQDLKKRGGHRSRSGSQKPQASYRPLDQSEVPGYAIGAAVVGAISLWAYWPMFMGLLSAWNKEPDYSHGYFVIPLAAFFLWARRESFPGIRTAVAWPGLALIVLSVVMRYVAAQYYVDAIDGWSLLVWLAGVVWLFGGWRMIQWSWPSIAFLIFMIPLPWKVERWLSVPLQRVATNLSSWVLQMFGQPALAEGNIIRIGDSTFEVADACSGLRIFVGIVALACAYLILVRRSWWERAVLVVSVIPIALIANSSRIVGMSLLNQVFTSEAAHDRIHDWSGLVMIPFAALLFFFVLWYLGKLFREVEVVDAGSMARRGSRE